MTDERIGMDLHRESGLPYDVEETIGRYFGCRYLSTCSSAGHDATCPARYLESARSVARAAIRAAKG